MLTTSQPLPNYFKAAPPVCYKAAHTCFLQGSPHLLAISKPHLFAKKQPLPAYYKSAPICLLKIPHTGDTESLDRCG